MGLSSDELKELEGDYRKLMLFYAKEVKPTVIASERYDPDQSFSLTAVNELRSALDHMARATCAMYSLAPDLQPAATTKTYDYCKSNLRKAHGHLYRAAYDAYDTIAIRLVADIDDLLRDVSYTALYTVEPEAADVIVAPFYEAKDLVSRAKTGKDVSTEATEFQQYEQATEMLEDVRTRLVFLMPEIVRVQRQERLSRATWISSVVLAVLFGVGGAAGFAFLRVVSEPPVFVMVGAVVVTVVAAAAASIAVFSLLRKSVRSPGRSTRG